MTVDAYKARQTEAEFQATVVEMARKLGWLDMHFPSMLANPSGFPDLILLRGGICIFAELKRENGTMGRRQREWAIDLEAAGFPVRIWRPSDWPEIEATLRGDAAESDIQPPSATMAAKGHRENAPRRADDA